MQVGRSILGLLVAFVVSGAFGVAAAQSASPHPRLSSPSIPTVPSLAPVVRAVAPEIVGIGGKLRLQGQNLGSDATAVVVFHPGVVAEEVERHTPDEIVVRVPIGAQSGPVKVATRVNAPVLRTLQTQIGVMEGSESPAVQAEIAQMKRQQGLLMAFARFSNPVQRTIIVPYMEPKPTIPPVIEEAGGLKIIRNRLIVDLKDFLSFDVALAIASRIGAELVGHFPITNSYVLDLHRAPKDLQALEAIIAQVRRDPRVADVWQDFVLKPRREQLPMFAYVDVVDRYRHNYNANLHGREDVWATDRIQAPGAWNLIMRFIGRGYLNRVKVAVLDTGCDHTHPEFAGVDLRKVVYAHMERVRVVGDDREGSPVNGHQLPLPTAFIEMPYDLGDRYSILHVPGVGDLHLQHGTMVVSLIGARNGNVLNDAGDRGINGLLHNPMPYTIQVYRNGDLREAGDTEESITNWLAGINMAALTGATIVNASFGWHLFESSTDHLRRARMRVALRKVARQLIQFRDKLLLVAAAGNDYDIVHPFEDLNLNNRLDAGEDLNGNGTLDFGNDIAGSLGTLPNVIAVGAIGGPDYSSPDDLSRDWARDDQRANFSNWGIPVTIAAPGTDVFMAGRQFIDRNGDRVADIHLSFLIGDAHFTRNDGTSFAAPLVTGTAALLKAIAPNLTPQQMKNYILNTSHEVKTTDRHGRLLRWWTLKTGYAVRQLMVDRGIIHNDQEWTGVSKVIYDTSEGLRVFEIRRAPGHGRAEAFADRPLYDIAGWSPSLTHDGSVLLWIASELMIMRRDLSTGETERVIELYPWAALEPVLEVSPNNRFLFGERVGSGCSQQVRVYVGPRDPPFLVADTGEFNTCRYRLRLFPRDWRQYYLHKVTWRPDSRVWAVDYSYQSGRGDTIHEDCHAWWGDHPFPTAPLTFPGCTGYRFQYPTWSPDGRAYAGVVSAQIEIAYYGASGRPNRPKRTHRAEAYNPPIIWMSWSPDGSELGYIGAGIFSTIRRDFRTPEDRVTRLLQAGLGGTFTWQW